MSPLNINDKSSGVQPCVSVSVTLSNISEIFPTRPQAGNSGICKEEEFFCHLFWIHFGIHLEGNISFWSTFFKSRVHFVEDVSHYKYSTAAVQLQLK